MRRAYGPQRDLGPGDLGLRELAEEDRDEDGDEQELDDGGSAELWSERDDDFLE